MTGLSLTSLLNIAEIREKFNKTFPRPNVKFDNEMLAAPQTKNYSLIGTAFDYLARFYIKSQNPDAVSTEWVADAGLEALQGYSGKYMYHIDLEAKTKKLVLNDEFKPDPNNPMQKSLELASENLDKAKQNYESYLKSNEITKPLIISAIHLAQLDFVYRAGHVNFSEIDDKDVVDLENLIKVFQNKKLFSKDSTIYLNPAFGDASKIVGGADADLIINDTLIDIKTTKSLKFDQRMHNQIVGYYLLSKIGKINSKKDIRINNIGIYFSRHGVLHTMPVSEIDNQTDIKEFSEWFVEMAGTSRKKISAKKRK